MVQEIITYAILGAAIGSAVFRFFKMVVHFKKSKSISTGGKCGGCSSGCALRDLPAVKSCSTPEKVRFSL